MRETRRNFLVSAGLLSSSLALPGQIFAAQNPPTPPPKPQPGYTPNPAEVYSHPEEAAAAKRARLLENEKEFRQGVERLYQLASDLRDELQKTPTADVFSLHIVKETEQIEKLAKSLKSKAKSS
jgi:hypothetical protein